MLWKLCSRFSVFGFVYARALIFHFIEKGPPAHLVPYQHVHQLGYPQELTPIHYVSKPFTKTFVTSNT